MASTNHRPFRCSFRSWMAQQQQDLDELVAANSSPAAAEEDLARLRDKCVAHFAEYAERRAAMAGQNPPCFLSPPWCSAFENAFMWVGGCRPSLFIRLIYHACGSELDAFLRGERKGNLAELTARQLEMINALHCKTVKEEDKFDTRIASLQEEIADEPLATMAKQSVGEWSEDVERAMVAHEAAMAEVLLAADRLRMETLEEVMGILTPLQAVDLLVEAKKLHISMHCWGCKREEQTSTSTS
ncbi:protein DELAY OF GERMINATION 1-like isoform X2 [Salvia hispanica]|uniref:protein DELAY OF GERMINATION 1-like isoform X1 n=1 Tax=Salvia hispanica TaxID=49212 RepID=UPI0020096D31|nr:protein DELAY OF GERMINATION 1-like isoform X1 [Salvia hispanica]XP_047962519.1 protein DELAY OF GERMINATION 1-like isoform X2 [Salvia hispanica]